MKINKNLECHAKKKQKKHENHKIPFQNYENHKNLRITCENIENH